jgi:hypothetical protein
MAGNPRLSLRNTTKPSFKSLWNLDEALAKIEADYDLVLIDTPPSMNALTRMAWVASDRVLFVTEPSINALLGVENAMKAFTELRKSVNRQVSLFGVLINRLRPSVAEHQYRVNELEETYGDYLISPAFEEKSAVQQSQGAGRSIHSWPGQSSAKIAIQFDELLEQLQASFVSESVPALETGRNKHSKRNRDSQIAPRASLAKTLNLEAEPVAPRIEMVESQPVSPEYQEQWNEVLRQTMTKKQLKKFLGSKQENED